MTTLLEELDSLISALKENGIEYAVCGGLALTIHGFPRATFDIDVLIQADSLEKAYEIAAGKGYDIRGLDISFKERAVEIRRVSKIDDDGEVLPLDFCWLRRKSRMFGLPGSARLAKQNIMDSLARTLD